MSKSNRILSIVLAAQVVLLVVVFFPRGATTAGGGSLFPGITADQIVKMTVHDDAGQQIDLAKGPNGWGVPKADDYPVADARMAALLEKITSIQTDRPVTKTASSLTRLKVSDQAYVRLIDLELTDGTHHKLYMGASPSYQVIHVRADDQDTVYLTIGLSESDAGAYTTDWIDTTYLKVNESDIQAYTLQNKNGTFEFEKDGSDAWMMKGLAAGEEFNVNNLYSLVTGASGLNLTEPLGRSELEAYGFQKPNATVTMTTKDGKAYTLVVGGMFEDGYVVKSSESPYYVLVATWAVSDWIERGKKEFLKQPTPTPGPTPTGTPAP